MIGYGAIKQLNQSFKQILFYLYTEYPISCHGLIQNKFNHFSAEKLENVIQIEKKNENSFHGK